MIRIAQQSTIYVGLNDRVTGKQKYDTEMYINILRDVCRSYKVPFSTHQIHGGYFHEDGRYVEENTLVLIVVGITDDVVREIAKDLCVFFNQESVMVCKELNTVYFIKESLDPDE